MEIQTPRDLPPEWHRKYLVLCARYRGTRIWASNDDADHAAFLETRCEFWRRKNLTRQLSQRRQASTPDEQADSIRI